jgi:hypothetical protein
MEHDLAMRLDTIIAQNNEIISCLHALLEEEPEEKEGAEMNGTGTMKGHNEIKDVRN